MAERLEPLPAWAEEMRQVFRAGATSQFVLHGNVFDLVPAPDGKGGTDYVSLRLPDRDHVRRRSTWSSSTTGARDRACASGGDTFHRFLKVRS